jgi:hypothetical protein
MSILNQSSATLTWDFVLFARCTGNVAQASAPTRSQVKDGALHDAQTFSCGWACRAEIALSAHLRGQTNRPTTWRPQSETRCVVPEYQ